jgi:hypothetical protein
MKKILEKIRKAYEKHGQAAAFDVANEHGLKYEYCWTCETSSPAVDHQCAICGCDTTTRMTHTEFFERTDYITLGQQKLTLLAILDKGGLHSTQVEDIEGLINFIDSFQDTAIDNGMKEEDVFIN